MSHYDYCCVLFAYRGQFGEQWIRTNFHMTVVIIRKVFIHDFLRYSMVVFSGLDFWRFGKVPNGAVWFLVLGLCFRGMVFFFVFLMSEMRF